jgi:hypothetical protein
MRIKFLHSISSADGWSHPPGRVVDFHDDELAAKFIKSGIAIFVLPEIETAVAAPPENTAARTARKKR